MQLKTIRYEELQDFVNRSVVKRAMQLSRYEIPEIVQKDPGKYPMQGTLCITEQAVQGYLYAVNTEQLAEITETCIRKKAVSKNIFKKRQEEFLKRYTEVSSLRKALEQLKKLCETYRGLTSMQDAVRNSLLVNDHERRTIFLKNKVAQRKYLARELERKETEEAARQKELGHLQRQIAQKQAQIKDAESRIQTTYSGRLARMLHRREADAEQAANAVLKEQADAFRAEEKELTVQKDHVVSELRRLQQELKTLTSQDSRLNSEIGKDEKSLERIQKNFNALKEREEEIRECTAAIRELASEGPLANMSFEELLEAGSMNEYPACMKDALDQLSSAAEDYLKAVSGIAEIQRQFVLLRDMLKGEAITDAETMRQSLQWLTMTVPVICMSEACRKEIEMPDLPAVTLTAE